jgi:hypothetical protein
MDKPLNECFSIIPKHVTRYGGKQCIGWAVWELWRKILIQAEFHTIWKSPDGVLMDLTPKILPVENILFVEDPRRQYEGVSVDNIRQPLTRDRRVIRLCELYRDRFTEMNQGDLANQYGMVKLPADVADRVRKIEDEVLKLEHELMEVYGQP